MAKVLSGREVSAEIQQRLKEEVAGMSVRPKLAVVQVGDREDSNVYIRMKRKFAEEIGATSELVKLSKETTEDQVSAIIHIMIRLIIMRSDASNDMDDAVSGRDCASERRPRSAWNHCAAATTV
jgi:hypothetical protein